MPRRLPKTNGNVTESKPICKSSRVLYAMRLQMSRPKLSVPRMWSGLKGGRKASVKRCSRGSYWVRSGAAIAMSTTIPSSTRPIASVRSTWIRRARVTGVNCASGTISGRAGPAPKAFSLIRDSRIEERVGQVHHEVHDDHQDRADHGDGLHDRVVTRSDGLDK